jgi:hypothetical protein
MAESLFLSPDELRDLTQRARRDGQVERLEAEGIPHRIVAGRVIVARFHVLQWLEGRPVAQSREPNFGAIA